MERLIKDDEFSSYCSTLLENRNSNITMQLACVFKIFEDFRLVAQIREEIEKVNQALFRKSLSTTK